MASGPMKITFFLQNGANGWSETYYNAVTDLTAGFVAGYRLAKIRSLLMGAGTALTALRVADAGNLRSSTLTGIGAQSDFPTPFTTYTSASDKVQTAALATLFFTTNGVRRPLYLRGNPDDLYEQTGLINPDAITWLGIFNGSFSTEIINGGWQIRYRLSNNPPTVRYQISTVAPSGINPSRTVLGFAAAIPSLPGTYIVVYGVRGLPSPMGVQKVVALGTAANSLELGYTLPSGYSYPGGGYATVFSPQYGTIDDISFRKIVSRKTGRPFGVSRGRARSRHP